MKKYNLKSWYKSGAPGVWMSGGAVAIAIIMTLGLLAVIATRGLGHFWPADVIEADYQVPGATFAEREGSYVNATDRLQSFRWAIRPPAGVRTEGQVYWQLLKRPGLYRASEVLAEIAREFATFSAAALGVPDVGVDLNVNQLAASG